MTETPEEIVDIPEPEKVAPERQPDTSDVDPGGDTPPPRREPELGEDPAYDPGGLGRQPDVSEEDEDYRG